MGLYSHFTAEQLTTERDALMAALRKRLIDPTAVSGHGRSVQFQQRTDDIRREIEDLNRELARRNGTASGGPIYLVG